ncbi:hypothetical protein ACA910_014564 [Epithemia clementina (nom. ined.)]
MLFRKSEGQLNLCGHASRLPAHAHNFASIDGTPNTKCKPSTSLRYIYYTKSKPSTSNTETSKPRLLTSFSAVPHCMIISAPIS